jgi:hypothetical protein
MRWCMFPTCGGVECISVVTWKVKKHLSRVCDIQDEFNAYRAQAESAVCIEE